MKDLAAADILAIPSDRPERLFTGDIAAAKKEYRRLAQTWHPDLARADPGVMAHINVLFDKAVEKIIAGTWAANGVLKITGRNGQAYEMRYLRHRSFELGEMYIAERLVAYVIDSAYADIAHAGKTMMRSFRYADNNMRAEVSRYLPHLEDVVEFDDKLLLIIRKEPDQILLRDVLEHFGGKVDPKHVAWILSRLYNVACYLQHASLVHNHIGPDTYFISPSKHAGALLGGWWYSTRAHVRLTAVPQRTVDFGPRDLLTKKTSDARVDLELIRATGRELLGDIGGTRLLMDKKIPGPLVNWLRSAATGDALEEYRTWFEKVLPASFGVRRFVELKLTERDIYC